MTGMHKPSLFLGIVAAAAVSTGCVVEHPVPPRYRPVAIEHGRVVATELVQRPGAAQEGAMVGGLLGFMLSGRSMPEKIFGTFWGAAAGSAIADDHAGPRQAWIYTVSFRDGRSQRVMTERADLRTGDCVAVESARYVNLRRVSDALCQNPPASSSAPPPAPSAQPPAPPPTAAPAPPPAAPPRDSAIDERSQVEASRCEHAKDELSKAKTREETEAAVKKVRVFCEM